MALGEMEIAIIGQRNRSLPTTRGALVCLVS